MSKKKLTEKELLEGMTPYNTHSDLLAKSETKPDWISFADGGERVTDDFMANRNEVFDEPSLDLLNPDIFLLLADTNQLKPVGRQQHHFALKSKLPAGFAADD